MKGLCLAALAALALCAAPAMGASLGDFLPTISLDEDKPDAAKPAPLLGAPKRAAAPKAAPAPQITTPEPKKQAASRPKREPVQKGQLAAGAKYSGNVKTHKFHSPGCKFYNCRDCVKAFNSRDAAIAAGYEACGKCGG